MPKSDTNVPGIVPRQTKRFGWIPDLPDNRDHLFAAPMLGLAGVPTSIDLRQKSPPVYDQGNLGSCTANAIGAAIQFNQMKQKLKKTFMPSRLFIYYNEREIEGTVAFDNGAMIRDGIKSVAAVGVCPESMWKYTDQDPGPYQTKPNAQCYSKAVQYRALNYARVTRNLNQMKGCLSSGYPFVFGFSVYDSFMSTKVKTTGIASMPNTQKEHLLGGHAVMAVGYDDKNSWFVVRNSWGTGWGMKGYFTMPYTYLLDGNLSDDFWTIRLVAG